MDNGIPVLLAKPQGGKTSSVTEKLKYLPTLKLVACLKAGDFCAIASTPRNSELTRFSVLPCNPSVFQTQLTRGRTEFWERLMEGERSTLNFPGKAGPLGVSVGDFLQRKKAM